MIFTQGNECAAVIDACVLVPMALCDFMLRLAEEPALYRPFWSEEILAEVATALEKKLGRTEKEVKWRIAQMKESFPEAMVNVPSELVKAVDCIPDKNDRHVIAAAIMAGANTIVTQNTRHFPAACLHRFGVLCQNADDFLIHQYHLCPQWVLDKLDDQAAGIGQSREVVIAALQKVAPAFTATLTQS